MDTMSDNISARNSVMVQSQDANKALVSRIGANFATNSTPEAYAETLFSKHGASALLDVSLWKEDRLTLSVVQALLLMTPDAAHKKASLASPAEDGVMGWGALHFAVAFRVGTKVVELLLTAYPGGVMVADEMGHLPLHCAVMLKTVQPKCIAYHDSQTMEETVEVVRSLLGTNKAGATAFTKSDELPIQSCTVTEQQSWTGCGDRIAGSIQGRCDGGPEIPQ